MVKLIVALFHFLIKETEVLLEIYIGKIFLIVVYVNFIFNSVKINESANIDFVSSILPFLLLSFILFINVVTYTLITQFSNYNYYSLRQFIQGLYTVVCVPINKEIAASINTFLLPYIAYIIIHGISTLHHGLLDNSISVDMAISKLDIMKHALYNEILFIYGFSIMNTFFSRRIMLANK